MMPPDNHKLKLSWTDIPTRAHSMPASVFSDWMMFPEMGADLPDIKVRMASHALKTTRFHRIVSRESHYA